MNNSLTRPLGENDIRRALPNARVMKYDELTRHSKLPKLPIVLLYETEPDFGHWVTILKTPEGIEHFDSYGIIPDEELKWISDDFRKQSSQVKQHLLRLLYNSGKKINYSPWKLQSMDSSVCGRWVILRNRMHKFTNDAFGKAVLGVSRDLGITPDELVVMATDDT